MTLDDVINATISGPDIISEQHDTSKIDVGGPAPSGLPSDGLRNQIAAIRQRGAWDAAEYGISAEAQISKLETALAEALVYERTPEGIEAARIAAEKALAEMRNRALRRASLDTSTGKVAVMVAGKAPWHKLGVNVAQAVNSRDAARLASIDWTVSKRPLAYQHPVGGENYFAQDDVFAIVRDDTGAFLGSVGSRYQCIQTADGFEFLDHVLSEFGARYESAGAIYGGKKVWMLAHLPQQRFAVNGSDIVEPYALVTLPHDGSGAGFVFPTTERVVCANTFRVAARDRGKGISLRHTGSIRGRIDDAKRALGIAVEGFSEFKGASEAMAAEPMPVDLVSVFPVQWSADHDCTGKTL